MFRVLRSADKVLRCADMGFEIASFIDDDALLPIALATKGLRDGVNHLLRRERTVTINGVTRVLPEDRSLVTSKKSVGKTITMLSWAVSMGLKIHGGHFADILKKEALSVCDEIKNDSLHNLYLNYDYVCTFRASLLVC